MRFTPFSRQSLLLPKYIAAFLLLTRWPSQFDPAKFFLEFMIEEWDLHHVLSELKMLLTYNFWDIQKFISFEEEKKAGMKWNNQKIRVHNNCIIIAKIILYKM